MVWIIIVMAIAILVEAYFLRQAWLYCKKLKRYLRYTDAQGVEHGALKDMEKKFDTLTYTLEKTFKLVNTKHNEQLDWVTGPGGGVPPSGDPNFPP